MLDLTAVKQQIDTMVAAQAEAGADAFEARIEAALVQLHRWSDRWALLAERVDRSRTSWLLAEPISGPLHEGRPAPPRSEQLSVAATDGSQIFPDRHEISPCFLINIGYVLLHYGASERPLLSSRPSLYWRDDELFEEWGGRRTAVNREQVGFRRSLLELTELVELAAASEGAGHDTVALTDGTLVFWGLEGRPPDVRDRCLSGLRAAFDLLAERRIPIAGYISRPGSPELVNALRVGLCPLDRVDCDHCPYKDEELPCAGPQGVSDAVMYRRVLEPGERSSLFASRSRVLDEYGSHRVHFFYLRGEDEVARVEVPAYVAENPDLLDTVHACLVDQVDKGDGYPVALAEAHERAVVRGAEREGFYRYLEEVFVRNDIRARVSRKGLRKRAVGV